MSTFIHTTKKQFNGDEDEEPYYVIFEESLDFRGDNQKFHINMSNSKGYTVATQISLSPEEAIKLRDGINRFLEQVKK